MATSRARPSSGSFRRMTSPRSSNSAICRLRTGAPIPSRAASSAARHSPSPTSRSTKCSAEPIPSPREVDAEIHRTALWRPNISCTKFADAPGARTTTFPNVPRLVGTESTRADPPPCCCVDQFSFMWGSWDTERTCRYDTDCAIDHFVDGCGDVDHHAAFIRPQRFEGGELGVQQRGRHEVA